jgi:pantoate--beta-alanine ligase
MKVIKSIKILKDELKKLKLKGKSIGFVPTMGALHNGHLALIKEARKENDIVVVSIFVNPTQFGPNEDYLRYPRPFKEDVKKCKEAEVDYIFAPDVETMYPDDYLTFVKVEKLSDILCGAFRKNHFRGVATVVLKLFNIVKPDIAYFGLKDYQQFIIIKKMIEDLNLDIKIKGIPTVRDLDGVALSSRNTYLSKEEREEATLLYKSLLGAKDLILNGERNSKKIKKFIYKKLTSGKIIKKKNIDYISIVHPEKLEELKYIEKEAVIALAVWVGKARLIDNIKIKI